METPPLIAPPRLPPNEAPISTANPLPQPQSPLFRLPSELRLQIYAHLFDTTPFSNLTIHLIHIANPATTTPQTRIAHTRCTSLLCKNRTCHPRSRATRYLNGKLTSSYAHANPYPNADTLPVSILRVCRAIYTEALRELYSSLTFDSDEPTTFIFFATRCIPRTHLALIRSVSAWFHVTYHVPLFVLDISHRRPSSTADARWVLFWAVVALCMPALERLGFEFEYAFVKGEYKRLGYADWARGMGWKSWVVPVLGVCGLSACEVDVEEVQTKLIDIARDDGMEALKGTKREFLEEVRRLLCREWTESYDDGFDVVRAVLMPEMCRGEKGRLRAFLERRYRVLVPDAEEDKLARLVDFSVGVLMGDTSIDVI